MLLLLLSDKSGSVSTTYFSVMSVSGLLVGLVVFIFIYFDVDRRGVSGSRRLLLPAGFGTSCFGGFFLPDAFDEQLQYTYLQLIKPEPIFVSPYEWATVNILTGLLISVLTVGFYFAGTRYTALQTTSDLS